MPEVHIVGELEGAAAFPQNNLFCKWKLITDAQFWELLEGVTEGQTQVDFPEDGEMAIWTHPIDVHYKTTSLKGWPKLSFQVWSQDMFGRNAFAGYGFCHVPTSPGNFNLEIVTYRPKGSVAEEIAAFFLGGHPQLVQDEMVHTTADRYILRTVTTGKIYVQLTLVLKDFAKFGLNWT